VSAQAFDDARATYNAREGNSMVAERAIDVARAGVEVTERAYADVVIRAPFAGVVTVKAAQPGEIVSPISAGGGFTRTGIGTIVDMSSLELEVDVGESYITRVRAEQAANVTLNAYPQWTIPAKVIAIIPTADRAKATVKVRVKLLELDGRVLPDMGARVSFLDVGSSAEDPLRESHATIVPASAVLPHGDESVVYVVSGNLVERRTVALGNGGVDGQEILSGISAGTRIAIGDLDRLSDGAVVRVMN
jgi:RND family efflux transporter MFP subunit